MYVTSEPSALSGRGTHCAAAGDAGRTGLWALINGGSSNQTVNAPSLPRTLFALGREAAWEDTDPQHNS